MAMPRTTMATQMGKLEQDVAVTRAAWRWGRTLLGLISCSDPQHGAAQAQEWVGERLKTVKAPQTISTTGLKNRLCRLTHLHGEQEA